MGNETHGADPIVMNHLDDAYIALQKATSACKCSDVKAVRDGMVINSIWDAEDMVTSIMDELFDMEYDEERRKK